MTTQFLQGNANVWLIPQPFVGQPNEIVTLEKGPTDARLFDIDFSQILSFGPITSVVAVSVDQGEIEFGQQVATATNCSIAATTGVLTATWASGTIATGQQLSGAGVPEGTVIGTNISGVGTTGVSTWNTNTTTAVPTFTAAMSNEVSVINPVQNIYPNGRIVQPGFIVQLLISGGIIPVGLSNLTCTITIEVATAFEQVSVSVPLLLNVLA